MIPTQSNVSRATAIRDEMREIRAEMKAKGIRRISCFNGGHTPDSYRLNARLFELKTRLQQELSRREA